MHVKAMLGLSAGAALALAVWAGCGSDPASPAPAAVPDAASAACPACVTDDDCGGGVCAQVGGDSYCAPACPNGNECVDDRACVPVTTVTGQQSSVCLPRMDVCSALPVEDSGAAMDTCGDLVGPNKKATCASCGSKPCQANGCYGGWWCNTVANRCQPPPATCDPPDSGTPFDGGGPVTGTVGANGGSISRLLFAVVGDTRPAAPNDTAAYPTAIITKIYKSIQALGARPPFVVSTGDYNFASTSNGEADAQIGLYMTARAQYSGAFYPAMGNHECTGGTSSNCGPGNVDGMTNNYNAFLSRMLGPIQKSLPYYEIDIKALDSSWTAKLLFVAANAWSTTQATWLETAMAVPTTYTIIVRHEPLDTTQTPGVSPSEAIMARYPYTLSLVGHTHTYAHYTGREALVGNGGAPLSGSKDYGFAIVNQRPDMALVLDMINYSTGLADSRFHFAVKPDGSPAP